MSADIRRYKSITKDMGTPEDLIVHAFVGGNKYGSAIQFNIGNSYCCVSEKQLLDLIDTIINRIMCREGYTATGFDSANVVLPDGEIAEVE